MMVWATLINESWIRKQNQIGNEWLVRNFTDVTTECDNFSYEETVDPDTQHRIKRGRRSAYKRQICVGLPVSLLFVLCIFAC